MVTTAIVTTTPTIGPLLKGNTGLISQAVVLTTIVSNVKIIGRAGPRDMIAEEVTMAADLATGTKGDPDIKK